MFLSELDYMKQKKPVILELFTFILLNCTKYVVHHSLSETDYH